jgi:hypothetical protein
VTTQVDPALSAFFFLFSPPLPFALVRSLFSFAEMNLLTVRDVYRPLPGWKHAKFRQLQPNCLCGFWTRLGLFSFDPRRDGSRLASPVTAVCLALFWG